MSAPAYQLLISEIISSSAAENRRPVVTIPVNLLKFLMRGAVASGSFDETGYLNAYPDIAQAIERGDFENGLQHYLAHGYFEGRVRGAVDVDENWYRQVYPDVDAAILAGEFASATDHFHTKGMMEWRAPRADAVAPLEMWKAIINGDELPATADLAGAPPSAAPREEQTDDAPAPQRHRPRPARAA